MNRSVHQLGAKTLVNVQHKFKIQANGPHIISAARPQIMRQSRMSVTAEAGLISRLGRIARSFIESLVSSAEDPERILEQAMQDMQADLIKMRQASAQVVASQRQVEYKVSNLRAQQQEWQQRAELALFKGEESLAREALKRKQAFEKQAGGLQKQLDMQKQAADQLVGNTKMLESKLAEAKSKKETLKARAASARTSKQIQEMVGAVDMSNSFAAFEKMEEKVASMEAEAEAVGVLAAGDALEQKFQALATPGVDDELESIKKRLAGGTGSSAKKSLPQSRPYKDEIDWEIEAIRSRVVPIS